MYRPQSIGLELKNDQRRIHSMSRLISSLLFGSMLVPVLGLAQNPPAIQPTAPAQPAVIGPVKIAWLALDQAIFSCEEGKIQFAEVQRFVDKKNAELEGLRKESDTLKNQLQVQGAKLTDEARADLEEQIEAKDTILQRFGQDTQKEIDSRRVKATNYIGRKMLPVIEKIAKEKGLSAVVYINNSRDAWVDPTLIITDEVIRAYNAAYPPSTLKAPAAPAPSPLKKP
jgi:Skp family chaperone for outer membrane proteins